MPFRNRSGPKLEGAERRGRRRWLLGGGVMKPSTDPPAWPRRGPSTAGRPRLAGSPVATTPPTTPTGRWHRTQAPPAHPHRRRAHEKGKAPDGWGPTPTVEDRPTQLLGKQLGEATRTPPPPATPPQHTPHPSNVTIAPKALRQPFPRPHPGFSSASPPTPPGNGAPGAARFRGRRSLTRKGPIWDPFRGRGWVVGVRTGLSSATPSGADEGLSRLRPTRRRPRPVSYIDTRRSSSNRAG